MSSTVARAVGRSVGRLSLGGRRGRDASNLARQDRKFELRVGGGVCTLKQPATASERRAIPPCCAVAGRRPRPCACSIHARCVVDPPHAPTFRCEDCRTRRRPVCPRSPPRRPGECTPGTSCASSSRRVRDRRLHQRCSRTTIATRWVADHPAALRPTMSASTLCPSAERDLACAFSCRGVWR